MSDTSLTPGAESLDAFRLRVREWLRANVRPLAELSPAERDRDDPAVVARSRVVQRMLFDAGLAGLVFPREYGGQGWRPSTNARTPKMRRTTSRRSSSRNRR